MNSDKMFPSTTLKASDFEQDAEMTIARVEMLTVGRGEDAEEKPAMWFEECEQAMILNKTKNAIIRESYGKETDDWIGKPIILFKGKTTYQGKRVDCIDIRIPKKKPVANGGVRKPAPKPVAADDDQEGD